ncbi:MAG: acyltransferase [Lachnospiraceae bacterium]|nr:acyltransferase [Lachnospiraceae bacterium]
MSRKREHLYYIDFLRIVSCIAVMVAHAHLEFVDRCYWSVLMFTLISGAMMLGRKELDIKKLYSKNILRIFTAFLIWSFIYAVTSHVIFPVMDGEPVRIKLMITSIVEGHFHLWYCYMLIGLYIVSPCIKAMLECEEKYGLYLMAVAFVFSILIPSFQNIKVLEWTKSVTDSIGLSGLRFLFYYILGYYIIKYDFTDLQRRIVYIAGVLSAVIYFCFPGGTFMYVWESGFVSGLFVAARYLTVIGNDRVKKTFYILGDAVFLTYLMHDMFNMIFKRFFSDHITKWYDLNLFLFTCILSFSFSLFIKYILKMVHKTDKDILIK